MTVAEMNRALTFSHFVQNGQYGTSTCLHALHVFLFVFIGRTYGISIDGIFILPLHKTFHEDVDGRTTVQYETHATRTKCRDVPLAKKVYMQ